MFVVTLRYTKPLAEIDRRMPEHVRFLEECYRAGVFLVSGRQVPRKGGVILAVGPSKKDLVEIPEKNKKGLEFIFASKIDDVLAAALTEKPKPLPASALLDSGDEARLPSSPPN